MTLVSIQNQRLSARLAAAGQMAVAGLCLFFAVAIGSHQIAWGESLPDWNAGVCKITPGTKIDFAKESAQLVDRHSRFNRLLYLGKPKLTAGSLDSVSQLISDNASLFSFTILASVTKQDAGFELREVGLGFSVAINGKMTVIDSQSADQLGANLGLIQNQVLARNETNLRPPKVLWRTTTMIVFDGDGLVEVGGRNTKRLIRHLVWVNPKTGRTAMAVWCLKESGGTTQIEKTLPLRLVPAGTREIRPIFVDGNEFFLSVPNELAFGLDDLPRGASFDWTSKLEKHLGRPDYDHSTIPALLSTINALIQSQ